MSLLDLFMRVVITEEEAIVVLPFTHLAAAELKIENNSVQIKVSPC